MAVSAMPETAVGSANGKSTIASTRRFPGKEYRTSIQATANPNTALITAATNEAPRLKPEGRQHARAADRLPDMVPGRCGRLDEQGRKRDEHDQAQVQQRIAQRQAEAGKDAAAFA